MHYIIILFSLLFLYSPINSKTRKVPITSKQQQVQPQSAQLKIMQPAPVSPAQRTQKLAPVKQIRITKRPTRKRTVRIARSKTTKSAAVSPAITPPVTPVAPAIIPPIAQAPVAIPASTQTPPSAQQTSTISLTSYNYNSASVLPIIKENNELFVILGQEALGDDKGTYDDFGGDRDFGEKHPIETAAREFHEEAILSQTAQMTLRNVRYHIDLAQPNTEVIIAYERTDRGKTRRNVTYITDFTQYAQQLFNTFYQARSKTKDQHSLEKDRIAKLKWTDLSDAIKRIPRGKPVRVVVDVLNPQTLKFEPELVVLRRFFVAKMRLYIENAPYKEGLNSKIRFYTQQ